MSIALGKKKQNVDSHSREWRRDSCYRGDRQQSAGIKTVMKFSNEQVQAYIHIYVYIYTKRGITESVRSSTRVQFHRKQPCKSAVQIV